MQRRPVYGPAGLRLPGSAPAPSVGRDDFQETHMLSPSVSTASYDSPRTPAVAFRPGTMMSSQSTGKEVPQIPEEYYVPYSSLDYQQHRQPAALGNAYDPYYHQPQPANPVRAFAPPPQNYGYEPGQYYAPVNPAAYPATQGYYDYAGYQQPAPAPASYYTPTGAQYAQHPREQEAQYPYNTMQPAAARQLQQTSPHRAPPNALQLEIAAASRSPRTAAQIPHAAPAHSPGASDASEPDGEFEYVFDCPDCGTSFLSLAALHAHLFIQYRRGWCPGVP